MILSFSDKNQLEKWYKTTWDETWSRHCDYQDGECESYCVIFNPPTFNLTVKRQNNKGQEQVLYLYGQKTVANDQFLSWNMFLGYRD